MPTGLFRLGRLGCLMTCLPCSHTVASIPQVQKRSSKNNGREVLASRSRSANRTIGKQTPRKRSSSSSRVLSRSTPNIREVNPQNFLDLSPGKEINCLVYPLQRVHLLFHNHLLSSPRHLHMDEIDDEIHQESLLYSAINPVEMQYSGLRHKWLLL